MKKPDAVTVIPKDTFRDKIWGLPAADLLGVGRATQRVLDSYCIRTIGDLAKTDPDFLNRRLGKNGIALWQYANGNDRSRVMNADFVSPVKSVGHGITTIEDLENDEQVWPVFLELTQDIGHKLRVQKIGLFRFVCIPDAVGKVFGLTGLALEGADLLDDLLHVIFAVLLKVIEPVAIGVGIHHKAAVLALGLSLKLRAHLRNERVKASHVRILYGLYLGGGYPELYAAQLSENRSMCSSVRAALEAGLPCIAECGGFMYLTEAIGEHPMVGFLPGRCFDAGKLARFGYVTLTAERDNLLCRAGGSIPAHEFHHWDAEQTGDTFTAAKPFGRSWPCVFATDTLYAGYPHFHFYANPSFAVRFLDACRKGKHHAGTDQTDGH